MENNKKDDKIVIKIASTEDFFDLNLCAREFIEFIDDFKKKFLDKRFFVLTAYFNGVLAGILVGEDKKKIDSLKKLVPTVYLHFLYVNPKYRNKHLGKALLNEFIKLQKKRDVASINIKLPEKFKKGIIFFQKNDFIITRKHKHKVVLECNLWNDFGIRNCHVIEKDFDNTF